MWRCAVESRAWRVGLSLFCLLGLAAADLSPFSPQTAWAWQDEASFLRYRSQRKDAQRAM